MSYDVMLAMPNLLHGLLEYGNSLEAIRRPSHEAFNLLVSLKE
jgi:hypothetical protein